MISDRDTDGRGYELGMGAEEAFRRTMSARGWWVEEATPEQNRTEHWDFRIMKERWSLRVDVKAEKRIRRWNRGTDAEWVWVELRNNFGMEGWLYSTEADYLAFQRGFRFYMVKPQALAEVVEQVVSPTMTDRPEDARYACYTRTGRNDLLTLINYSDLPVSAVVAHKEDYYE